MAILLNQCVQRFVRLCDEVRIDILAESMDYEEAVEYFEYNVIGAYVGEQTPIFLRYPENS